MKYSMFDETGSHLQCKTSGIVEGSLLNNMDSIRLQNMGKPTRKTKRFRSAFTTEQVNYLEQQFRKFPYISSEHRKEIATALNMQERAIKIWFQNRRMKEKKEICHKEQHTDSNNKDVLFKDRLINVCAQSTNGQPSYSLPTPKPSVTNTVTKANTDRVQHNNTHLRQQILTPGNQFPGIKYHLQTAPLSTNKTTPSFKPSQQQRKDDQISKHELRKMLQGRSSTSKPKAVPEIQSSKKKKCQPSKPAKYGKINDPAFIPMMPTVFAHPYISTGGMIWKPVNVMSVMPGNSMNIPRHSYENGSGQIMNCDCNCHGNTRTHISVTPNPMNPYAQYVLTAPFPKDSSSP